MSDEFDIDGDDFDDFNFDDFDMGSMEQDEASSDRSPIAKVKRSALEKFDELSDDKLLHGKVLDNALPDGYRVAKDEARDFKDGVSRVYDDAVKEVAPAVRDMKKATNKLLENNKGLLPDSIHERLAKMTETPEQSAAQSQEQMQNDRITNELGSMTATLAEIQSVNTAQQAQSNAEGAATGKAQHKESILTLGGLGGKMDRQIAFSERITSVYYQKSLDLQFRQFFAQRDLLELQKRSNVDIVTNLKAIAKNSGLPDMVKFRNSEQLKNALENEMFGKVTESITSAGAGFKDRAMENIRNKVMETAGAASQAMDGLTMGIDTMNTMAESGMGEKFDPMSFLVKSLIGAGTSKAANAAAGQLQKILLDNPDIAMGDAQLKAGMGQLDSFIPHLLSQVENKDGIVGKAATALQGFLPKQTTFSNKVGHNLQASGNDVAPNTVMVNRSITEIIPEFLSMQLHELRILNGMDRASPRLVYNTQREAMTTTTQLGNDILGSLNLGAKSEEAKSSLDNSLKLALGDKIEDYTEEEQAALAKQFQKMGKSGEYFSVDTLTDTSRYEDLDPVTAAAIAKMNSQYTDPKERLRAERAMAAVSGNARQGHIDVQEEIRKVVGSNDKAILRSMGLLYQDESGTDKVDENLLDNSVFNKELLNKFDGKDSYSAATGMSGPNINGPNLGGSNVNQNVDTTGLVGRDYTSNLLDINKGITSIYEHLTSMSTNKVNPENTGSMPGLNVTNDLLTSIRDSLVEGLTIKGGSIVTVDAELLKSMSPDSSFFGDLATGAMSGIKTGGGKLLSLTGDFYSAAFGAGKSILSGAQSMASSAWSGLTEKVTSSDLYLKGTNRVALTKAQIESGTLIDELTGNIITKVEDITGPVKNAAGDYLVTAEEFVKGLYDRVGKSRLSNALEWVKDKPATWLSNYYGFVGKLPGKAFDFIKGLGTTIRPVVDVYVQGKPGVALQATLLNNGGYRNVSDQSPVNSIDDINGDVEDLQGRVCLLSEDLDKLVDRNGDPIKSSKLSSIIGDLASGALNFGKNMISKSYSAIGNVYKRIFGLGDHEGKGILEGLKGFFTSKVSLMRVAADTVIIEGTPISNSTLERQTGEDPVSYSERITAAARMAKSKASASFSDIQDKAKSIYDDAATSAYVYADDARQKIRDEINDPEGLIQTTKEKGQSAIGRMTESLSEIAASTKETAEEAKAKVFGDANGDGERDGSFRSRLAGFKDKLTGGGKTSREVEGADDKPKEEKEGLISKLMGGLGLGAGGLMKMIPILLGGFGLLKGLTGLFGLGGDGEGGMDGMMNNIMSSAGGMSGANMAMTAGGAALLMPGTTAKLVKGTAKGAWATGKAGARLGGLVSRQGVKGAFTALTRVPGLAGMLARLPLMMLNPWVLGAVAVAGVGYGAYKAGKYFARRSEVEDVEALRFAHYGFDRHDIDHLVQIRYLEDELADSITYDDEGSAILELDTEKLVMTYASDFGVDLQDAEQVGPFLHWMVTRFVPAYRKQWTVIHKLDPTVDLLDIDDELADGAKPLFAKSIRLQQGGEYQPYDDPSSPFPGHRLITGLRLIESLEADIVTKFATESIEYNEEQTRKTELAKANIGKPGYDEKGEREVTSIRGSYVAAGPGGAHNLRVAQKAGSLSIEGLELDTDLIKGMGLTEKPLGKLESMRMHYYGLSDLTGLELKAVRALEAEVLPTIEDKWYTRLKSPSVGASDNAMWGKFALLFGWNPKDFAAKRQWMSWYRRRFLVVAVYQQGVLNVIKEDGYRLQEIDETLKGKDLISFLAAFRVKGEGPEKVTSQPFNGKDISNDMLGLWTALSQALTDAGKGDKLADPILSMMNKDATKDESKAPSNNVDDDDESEKDSPSYGSKKMNSRVAKARKRVSAMKAAQILRGGKFNSNGNATNKVDVSVDTKTYDGYQPKNGAKAEPWSLDDDVENRIKTYEGIIAEASKEYNVPQELIRAIIRQESSGNPSARSNVGAQGLMQLMPGTARDMGVSNAYDPYQNIMGGTKYIGKQLEWSEGNIPEALAGYNGGRGYVLEAKKQSRARLGREPSSKEMLSELSNVSFNGKRPDYKQMQNYVAKIAPGYASRARLSLDEVYGSGGDISVTTTDTGASVPANNISSTKTNMSASKTVVTAPIKPAADNVGRVDNVVNVDSTKPSIKAVDQEVVKEVIAKTTTTRRMSQINNSRAGSLTMLNRQLTELTSIRKGIDMLVKNSLPIVVTETNPDGTATSIEKELKNQSAKQPEIQYVLRDTSVDMS